MTETTIDPTATVDLGDGRVVIFNEPTVGMYRVRMPSGEVQGFPAKADATPDNAVDDIVTNPPAAVTPAVSLTRLTIYSRLTATEQTAITTSTDPAVINWLTTFLAADFVTTADPRTQQGMDLLVSKGLLTSDRPAQLLAP